MAKKAKSAIKKAQTEPYKHPEAKNLMRPEVGTQAQFKKKKPPKTYRYVPDFIIRLKTEPVSYLILETKGYDPLEDVKRAAAERWVAAVNADGTYGKWRFAVAKKVSDVPGLLQ